MVKPGYVAFYCASGALLIGLFAFTYNWLVVGGGWSWFPVLLFPGNLVNACLNRETALATFSDSVAQTRLEYQPKFSK